MGDTVPPFGLAFSSGKPFAYVHISVENETNLSFHLLTVGTLLLLAGDMQNVLAAANEEGVVRIYNTESRKNSLLKGICKKTTLFTIVLCITMKCWWIIGCELYRVAGSWECSLWHCLGTRGVSAGKCKCIPLSYFTVCTLYFRSAYKASCKLFVSFH